MATKNNPLINKYGSLNWKLFYRIKIVWWGWYIEKTYATLALYIISLISSYSVSSMTASTTTWIKRWRSLCQSCRCSQVGLTHQANTDLRWSYFYCAHILSESICVKWKCISQAANTIAIIARLIWPRINNLWRIQMGSGGSWHSFLNQFRSQKCRTALKTWFETQTFLEWRPELEANQILVRHHFDLPLVVVAIF